MVNISSGNTALPYYPSLTAFQGFRKGMQYSKVSMREGHHISMEGIQKGYLFSQKWYIKG